MLIRGHLRAPEGDGGGAGGAGGADAPKYITEEQLNKAITKRLNDGFTSFKKEITGSITETISGLTSQIDAALDAKLAKFAPAQQAGPKAGEGAAATPAIHETPEWKGMLKKQAELEQSVKRADEARAAERAKSRDVALRQTVAEGLVKRGIDATRAPHALGYVLDAKKLAKYAGDNDDASITFRDADGSEVDLDTGLDGWVKSDDAKIYLPPRGSAGSGDRGGGRRGSGGQKQEATFEDVGNFVLDAFPSMSGPRR